MNEYPPRQPIFFRGKKWSQNLSRVEKSLLQVRTTLQGNWYFYSDSTTQASGVSTFLTAPSERAHFFTWYDRETKTGKQHSQWLFTVTLLYSPLARTSHPALPNANYHWYSTLKMYPLTWYTRTILTYEPPCLYPQPLPFLKQSFSFMHVHITFTSNSWKILPVTIHLPCFSLG